MIEDLEKTTRNAIIWNALDKVSNQVISIVIGIILARILNSSDYGLIGMLAIFVAIANSCIDSGFSSALVRKQNPTEADYNTVFYCNLLISFIIYIFLFLGAPNIASFFDQPILIPLSRSLFCIFLINALGLIQTAHLVKEIQFRKVTIINFLSLFISGLTALYYALHNYGAWALVAQMLSQSVSRTILLWIIGKWHPKAVFSIKSFRELFAFGSNILLANILNSIFLNIYSAFIGRLYGKTSLGFYTQASKWADMGISTLYGTIQNATYTVFSAIQNEKERLVKAYRDTMKLTAFITFPSLLCFILISKPFVLIFLSEKWTESIIYLQLLCAAGIFTVFTTINGNYIKISGHSHLVLRLEVIKIGLIFITIFLTWHMGMLHMVISLVIVRIIVYILSIIIIGEKVDYPWYTQLKDIFPYLSIGIILFLTSLSFTIFISNIYFLGIIQIGFFFTSYYSIFRYMNRHYSLFN